MTTVAVLLSAAVLAGLLAVTLRLPPMVGFLSAGFALNAAGVAEPAGLETIAGAGVTVLLFAVGVKFDVVTLLRREVWLPGIVQLVGSTIAAMALLGLAALTGLALLNDLDLLGAATIGLVLSFSSTVLVVKLLEDRGLEQSLVGRTTIGILVLQDLVAVLLITVAHGTAPSPWAPAILLVLPAVAGLARLAHHLAPAELLPLVGIALAFVPGYALFDAVGLKGDLGALVVGIVVGTQPGSAAIAKSLLGPKDLLLVGFFLSIGFSGVPGPADLLIAALLVLLVVPKSLLLAVLFRRCGFRRRTSALSSSILGNHSEFALIAAVSLGGLGVHSGWLTPLATAVALSMVLSAVVVRRGDGPVNFLARHLPGADSRDLHLEDRPIDVGGAHAVVLGMGRVGQAAYARLTEKHGLDVVAIELDPARVAGLRERGWNVLQGDAADPEFWGRVCATPAVNVAVLAMPFHGRNLDAQERLRAGGFAGTVAVVTQRDDDLEQALQRGAAAGVQIYDGAGAELADRAVEASRKRGF